MIEEAILADPRLQHRDVRVYGVLAKSRRGPFVTMGERLISECIPKMTRRSVRGCIGRLIAAGHVEQIIEKRGKRAQYRLTSALFGAMRKPSIGAESGDKPTAKSATSAPLLKCGVCGAGCKKLLKAGWCRSCNADKRLDKTIDKKLDERGVPAAKELAA